MANQTNSRSGRRPSGRCLSERVDIFLSSGEPSGWSKHDVCDRRPATWMSPRAVPVRMRYTLSTALENSHSETDICLRAFCRFGSSSGLRLPPLRTMPIHKIVSKERCQSYFIYGCQVRPIRRDARYKNRVNQPRLCASAHRGVPLYFCMARSYANFLVISGPGADFPALHPAHTACPSRCRGRSWAYWHRGSRSRR